MNCLGRLTASVSALVTAIGAVGAERTETFDLDPRWDAHNCRAVAAGREVRQDFGFSGMTAHCAAKGEIGGFIHPAAEPAYYAKVISPRTLDYTLAASGKLVCEGRQGNALIGFFHSEHSLDNGGSDSFSVPPDFLGVRIGGPSREGFFFAPAYRIHGPQEKTLDGGPFIYPNGATHTWACEYNPGAANGRGQIIVKLDSETARLDLEPGQKTSGAPFNRFGLITTHHDGNGQRVYFDHLTYTTSQH